MDQNTTFESGGAFMTSAIQLLALWRWKGVYYLIYLHHLGRVWFSKHFVSE